ncbi:MAG: FCD domain-containing protein, partial [Rhodococcus sp. (in: high G+C Gram-positive bacteria)]
STPTEFVDADMELHRAVVNAAHNSVLSMVFDSFIETLRNSALDVITDVAARDPESIDDEAAAHRDLVEAIVAGDADAASAATRRNMDGLD